MSEENSLSILTAPNEWQIGTNDSWLLGASNATTNVQTLIQNSAIYRIQLWVVPFLVAFGGVGNVLSLWVFCSPAFKGHSSSCYLAALAASDTLFLITLLLVWVSNTLIDLYNLQGWCQGIIYLTYVATFVSVWLIVAFTVERFIAVCYPLLRSVVCTVRRARIIVCVLVSVAVSLYSYLLLAAGLESATPDGAFRCTLREGWGTVASVMNSVDTLLTLILPVIAVVSLNLRIARCVYYVDKLGSKELSATGQPVPQWRFVSQKKRKREGHEEREEAYCATYSAHKSKRSQHNVTKMLLVISTIFILLNLPSYVMRAYMYFTSLYDSEENQHSMTLYTLEQTFTLLFYSNFAVNFLLYCVTGQNFRRAVSTLFVPQSKRQLCTHMRASTLVRTRLNNASTSHGSTNLRRASQSSRPGTASVMLVEFTEGSSRFSTKRKSLKRTKNPDVAMTTIISPEDVRPYQDETPLNGQCYNNSQSSNVLHPLINNE